MLIVKRNIYRNVSAQEAEKFKQLGYKEVVKADNKATAKRGGKNGDTNN
ncbi:MAG: hypothetical protein IJX57_06055 [Clostridia bacterium]|nr:hypothetical protein [Clostridia bacterium]